MVFSSLDIVHIRYQNLRVKHFNLALSPLAEIDPDFLQELHGLWSSVGLLAARVRISFPLLVVSKVVSLHLSQRQTFEETQAEWYWDNQKKQSSYVRKVAQ